MSPYRFSFTAMLLLITSIAALAQKTVPKTRVIEPDHTISSKLMGRDYQLYISFPAGYSATDTVSYPVLYVLDGGAASHCFEALDAAHKLLEVTGEVEKVILVGIESGLDSKTWFLTRAFDFTPSSDTTVDRMLEKTTGMARGTYKSGGAAKFLECLKTEIIPFVEQHYKTNGDRGITGHSFGGLFTAWCFVNAPGYFARYGINSPSLWWNKEEVLNEGLEKFKANQTWNTPPTKVFVSAGGLEGPDMIPAMVRFATTLEIKHYKNIDEQWKIFDGDTHLSVVPTMLTRTLVVLYGKK